MLSANNSDNATPRPNTPKSSSVKSSKQRSSSVQSRDLTSSPSLQRRNPSPWRSPSPVTSPATTRRRLSTASNSSSNLPKSATATPSATSATTSSTTTRSLLASSATKQRLQSKDAAIRSKAEQSLRKRSSNVVGLTAKTVLARAPTESLEDSQVATATLCRDVLLQRAETLPVTASVWDAVQIMAAKRLDALLIRNAQQQLVGIITDKDVAFRCVLERLDPRKTRLESIMTRDPVCVLETTSVTQALDRMHQGHFRHLPIVSSQDKLLGLLDVTQCLVEALQKNQEWQQQSTSLVWEVATPLDKMATVTMKSSVMEALKQMREKRETACLILEGAAQVQGIFTTKDVVLRVLAADLDPNKTSIVRVMTPHPDTIAPDTRLVEALQQMHHRHYLHLPVCQQQSLQGCVNVLQLTLHLLDTSVSSPWQIFWGKEEHEQDVEQGEQSVEQEETIPVPNSSTTLEMIRQYQAPSAATSLHCTADGTTLVGPEEESSFHEERPLSAVAPRETVYVIDVPWLSQPLTFPASATSFDTFMQVLVSRLAWHGQGGTLRVMTDQGQLIMDDLSLGSVTWPPVKTHVRLQLQTEERPPSVVWRLLGASTLITVSLTAVFLLRPQWWQRARDALSNLVHD